MKDFSKKLLGIYGTIMFFISLFVFYVIFKGIYILSSFTNKVKPTDITIFYIIATIMSSAYICFIIIVILSIIKGKEKDLRFKSLEEYVNWRLKWPNTNSQIFSIILSSHYFFFVFNVWKNICISITFFHHFYIYILLI